MRIRQIVFAAQDLARSRALLQGLLTLPDPFRDPGVAEFGIDNAVFTFGDQFIEVISPTRDDSACARHLTRHRAGIRHVCAPPGFGIPGAFDSLVHRLNPRFVIARFGGVALGPVNALNRLLTVSTGAFVLVR